MLRDSRGVVSTEFGTLQHATMEHANNIFKSLKNKFLSLENKEFIVIFKLSFPKLFIYLCGKTVLLALTGQRPEMLTPYNAEDSPYHHSKGYLSQNHNATAVEMPAQKETKPF